jgi:deoxyribonuclease IV
MALHVREIIKHLPKEFAQQCGFPCDQQWVRLGEAETPKGSVPEWVSKRRCHSQYGMLMDVLVRQMLFDLGCRYQVTTMVSAEEIPASMRQWDIGLFATSEAVFASYHSKSKLPAESTVRSSMDLEGVYEWLQKIVFDSCACPNVMLLAPEFNHGYVTGHPDLVFDHCVIDIKTTKNFKAMRRETILQLLSYYCLLKISRANSPSSVKVTSVGVLLPVTRELQYYTVPESFDWKRFWDGVEAIASGPLNRHRTRDLNVIALGMLYQGHDTIFRTLGNTIKKEKGSISYSVGKYLNELKKYGERWAQPACQLYIHSPRSKALVKVKEEDLSKAHALISEAGLAFYTHTPYVINLCDLDATSRDEEGVAEKALQVVRADLELTAKLGGRGVVIHTGKSKKLPVRTAVLKMRREIINLLEHASEQTPLLLETGAGQGTELCCSAKSMSLLYHSIPDHLRSRFGICVDTCHVFSFGEDPYQYILQLDHLAPGSIKLIHYNNSAVPKGAHHDSHAALLDGYIDAKCLYDVAVWARRTKTPLVRE